MREYERGKRNKAWKEACSAINPYGRVKDDDRGQIGILAGLIYISDSIGVAINEAAEIVSRKSEKVVDKEVIT